MAISPDDPRLSINSKGSKSKRAVTLQQLIAELGQAEPRAIREVSKVVRSAGLEVQRVSRSIVPRDTGFLRLSITVSDEDGGRVSARTMSVEVGPEAAYGGYVEEGTSRMAGRFYMKQALEQVAPKFIDRLTQIGPLDA